MYEEEKKPIKHLHFWNEARDVLINVNMENRQLVFENFSILLPSTSKDTLTQLELHVGKLVSILRTDLNNRPILYIVLPNKVTHNRMKDLKT